MTEYYILLQTKITAKNKKELHKKTETITETISKNLKKKIEPYGYVEIEKKDTPTIQTRLQ